MPDISKCEGKGCTLRDKCYRFTVMGTEWQSYTAYWEDVEVDGRGQTVCKNHKQNRPQMATAYEDTRT